MRSWLLRWLHCWHSGGLPALRLPSHWPRQPVSPGTDSKTSHSTSIYSSRQRCVQPTLPCLQQILLSHKFWSLIHFRFRTNRHEISCVHFHTEIIWLCVLTSFKSGFSKTKKKSYSTLKNSEDISTANPQVFHIQVSSIFKIFNAGNSRKRMKSPLKDFFPVNSQQKRNVTLNYSVQLVMNRVSAL